MEISGTTVNCNLAWAHTIRPAMFKQSNRFFLKKKKKIPWALDGILANGLKCSSTVVGFQSILAHTCNGLYTYLFN